MPGYHQRPFSCGFVGNDQFPLDLMPDWLFRLSPEEWVRAAVRELGAGRLERVHGGDAVFSPRLAGFVLDAADCPVLQAVTVGVRLVGVVVAVVGLGQFTGVLPG